MVEMPGPQLVLGRHRLPAWRAAAVVGSLWGILLAAILAAATGRSPALAAGTALAGALGGLALALTRTAWYGSRGYTFYHHQFAALASGGVFLWLMGRPLLPTLDLGVPGLATAVAVGRLGCLVAGCCHGRPQGWGICYGAGHVAARFPRYLAGVRLFPLQALESLWALAIAVAGSALALSGVQPGAVLSWTLVSYGLGRFAFEFLRGDAARPYWRGLSEAQWTSLLVVGGVAGGELAGVLPFRAWHVLAAAVLVVVALGALVAGRPLGCLNRHSLIRARHIKEVAEAMAAAEAAALARAREELAGGIQVARTSLGLQISASLYRFSDDGERAWHYALSCPSGPLGEATARALGALMFRLRPSARAWRLLHATGTPPPRGEGKEGTGSPPPSSLCSGGHGLGGEGDESRSSRPEIFHLLLFPPEPEVP